MKMTSRFLGRICFRDKNYHDGYEICSIQVPIGKISNCHALHRYLSDNKGYIPLSDDNCLVHRVFDIFDLADIAIAFPEDKEIQEIIKYATDFLCSCPNDEGRHIFYEANCWLKKRNKKQ